MGLTGNSTQSPGCTWVPVASSTVSHMPTRPSTLSRCPSAVTPSRGG